MLTELLFLSLQITSILTAPCKPVEWPTMQPPGLYAFGVPLPRRECCWSTLGVASFEYDVGIDAAVPPQSEERSDLDIYAPDEP